MKHKLFTTLLAMLMSMAGANAFASDNWDFSVDGFVIHYNYIKNGTEWEVSAETTQSGYQHNDNWNGQVTIPDYFLGLPVTSIETGAFSGCSEIHSVTFPSTITHIGTDVFSGGLEEVYLDLLSWYNVVLEGPLGSNLDYYDTNGNFKIENLVVPETITHLGDYLFSGCKSITSLIIPGTVESIGKNVFMNCVGITSLTLEYGLANIGEGMFSGCSGITEIIIPGSVTKICDEAFINCKKLKSIVISEGIESIGRSSFSHSLIESVYIPQSVAEIEPFAFYWCNNLTSISVSPYNSHYDSRNGFNGIIDTATGMLLIASPSKEYNIPSGVTSIAIGAIWPKKEVIGSSLESELDIVRIVLPEGLIKLERGAISNCHLGKVSIPSTIEEVEYEGFYRCAIDTLDISDIKTWCNAIQETPFNGSLAYYLFNNGEKVTKLIIPSGTEKVCGQPFAYAHDISSVIIPNSVTCIGDYALDLPDLSEIYVEQYTPLSLSAPINNEPSNVTLYVPRGSKAAYEAADYWKDFKEIKEYGDGNATFTMNSSNISTYSNVSDLDFTSVEGLKAYIASGFKPSTGELTMTRVYEVPAGEGLLLKGAAGSYEIPYTETDMYYSNLLVGVPTATTVNPTEGDYTNFILANGANGIGFYTLSAAGEIGPNKAYLQLPTSVLPATSNSRQVKLIFEDEEEVTGIESLTPSPSPKGEGSGYYYALDGRKLMQKPAKAGLYVKDGKKVFVK